MRGFSCRHYSHGVVLLEDHTPRVCFCQSNWHLLCVLFHLLYILYYSTVISSLINCNYYRILSFSIMFINQMILTLTPVNLAKDVSRSFDILKWVIGTLKPVTSQWSRLSCGLTTHVVSPLKGSPLKWVHLSCGLTSHVVSPLKGSPLMWSHLSCGFTTELAYLSYRP